TWLFDPVSGLVTSSEEVRRMFGASLGDAPDEHLFSRLHPEDRPWVEAALKSAMQNSKTYDTEFRIVTNDGIRWIRSKGRLLDTRLGPARLIGFAEDITERKAAEQALEQSQKELEK